MSRARLTIFFVCSVLATASAFAQTDPYGATLQVSVDPTITDGTPNVTITYTFGAYTNSNYLWLFHNGIAELPLFTWTHSGTWNLALSPGSYTVYAVVNGGTVAAIAVFSVPQPPPQNQNGAIPGFDLSDATLPSADNRILMSIAPWDHFESRFQVASPVAGVARFRVSGTLTDYLTHQPKPGTVYLRLEDPADTAAYVVGAGDARAGDNLGACASLGGTVTGSSCQAPLATQADANGRFEAIVAAPLSAAGNNYQATASFDPNFSCRAPNPCAKSGIFTLWKRIYVEEEHMFRTGAFIRDFAESGGNRIPVSEAAPFQVLTSDVSQLELIHADRGQGEGFYFDFVTFHSLEQDADGAWSIRVNGTVPRDYGELHDPQQATQGQNPITDVMRDAIGVVGAGTFDPVDDLVNPLFETMFVEVRDTPPLVVAEVPYIPELRYQTALYFSSQWLENGMTINAFSRHVNPNVFHRMTVTQTPLVRDAQTGRRGAELGVTLVGGGSNYSLILVQRVADITAGRIPDPLAPSGLAGQEYLNLFAPRVEGEVTAHETVHFWVHTGGSDGHGHCAHQRWQHDGLNCLMHVPYAGPGLGDGLVDLHYENHGGNSEYITVRQAADPVSQN